MKVQITKDVDGMKAGDIHDLRDGYATALVAQSKALYAVKELPPVATHSYEEFVIDPTPIDKTVTEAPDIVDNPVNLDE